MRGHVEQLSVTANQRAALRMDSCETKGNKEMKQKHKPLWANSFTSELCNMLVTLGAIILSLKNGFAKRKKPYNVILLSLFFFGALYYIF